MAQPILTLNEPPPSNRRRWIVGGILLFLLFQTAIPASYYVQNEPTSERFAWRMFSSIHMSQWDTRVIAVVEKDGQLVERQIPLASMLQETHVKTIRAAQLDIVEPFMRQVASQPGVREVRFEADGTYPSGKPMKPIRLGLNPGGKLINLTKAGLGSSR